MLEGQGHFLKGGGPEEDAEELTGCTSLGWCLLWQWNCKRELMY